MSKRLTDEELQAIRERAEKATAGEWRFVPIDDSLEYFVVGENRNEAVASGVFMLNDAAFIAHARQDIPKLLAEIDRLEAENKALKEESSKYSSIALWSARRLATRRYAEYAYDEIEKVYGYAVDRDWRGEQV